MSESSSPRVTRRRAETRARLLAAAYEVFADKGFGHVRIEDVCAAAGYTRGAFYSQFASLDELFFVLYDERAELIATQVASTLGVDPEGTANDADRDAESVADVIARVTSTLLLDRAWIVVKTDFLLHAARHPEVAERLDQHRRALRAAVAERLAEQWSRTAPPPGLADADTAAAAVVAVYDGVATQLLLDGDEAAARAWLTELLTVLLERS